MFSITRPRSRQHARGQSLVELALALPVLLLIVLVAIDFGRAFSGYITLTNATRIGANFAASYATAWDSPGSPADRNTYEELIQRDTDVANCDLVGGTPPAPTFIDGSDDGTTRTDVGDRTDVGLSCTFRPITPIVSAIVGSSLVMSANSDFAIRAGTVAGVPVPPPAPPPPTPTPTPTPTPGCSLVVVPNVDGMTPTNANATIASAGLVPSGIGDLTTGPKNSAKNQSPAAGECVALGTTVTYHYRP